ncbi:unnamed protein product [Allacma fusca]|uniref:Uncharacterized protein n=1 Tax=Allacma fusca TaxID=39272 RepID=A0A8J2JIN9_9HEXA|nr:unnamed protein product [Allacma fusca]
MPLQTSQSDGKRREFGVQQEGEKHDRETKKKNGDVLSGAKNQNLSISLDLIISPEISYLILFEVSQECGLGKIVSVEKMRSSILLGIPGTEDSEEKAGLLLLERKETESWKTVLVSEDEWASVDGHLSHDLIAF